MNHSSIESCLANIAIASRLLSGRILSKKERKEIMEIAARALVTLRYLCHENEQEVQRHLNRL